MQYYTAELLPQAYNTNVWKTIALTILSHITKKTPLPNHYITQTYTTAFPESIAHYKNCVILYSSQEYILTCAPAPQTIKKPYTHEHDTIYYESVTPTQGYTIPAGQYCTLPPKTIYSILPQHENTMISAFFIPHYHVMEGDAFVEIQCFSMLQAFMPENAEAYPILLTWTLTDVIDSLGIEIDLVRIIFVDNVATHKETAVRPNTKITLFPGIGGG